MTAICAESLGIAAGVQVSFAERQLSQALRAEATLMLLAPLRAGPAHVVPLRAIGREHVLFQHAPYANCQRGDGEP
jgi:hypothetical protein